MESAYFIWSYALVFAIKSYKQAVPTLSVIFIPNVFVYQFGI